MCPFKDEELGMAQITLAELVELVEGSPLYRERWYSGVPARDVLYVEFDDSEPRGLKSRVHEMSNGRELVLNIDSSGRVHGIEIQ